MILQVQLIIDEEALVEAISDFPGGSDAFLQLLTELGNWSRRLQEYLLGDTKGFSMKERVVWFDKKPEDADELEELFGRVNEIRQLIGSVLRGTFVREQVLNRVLPLIFREVMDFGFLNVGFPELSVPERDLRAALEALPKQ